MAKSFSADATPNMTIALTLTDPSASFDQSAQDRLRQGLAYAMGIPSSWVSLQSVSGSHVVAAVTIPVTASKTVTTTSLSNKINSYDKGKLQAVMGVTVDTAAIAVAVVTPATSSTGSGSGAASGTGAGAASTGVQGNTAVAGAMSSTVVGTSTIFPPNCPPGK